MEEKRKSDWGFAIFLILAGAVLLLNTTGFVDWNVWTYIVKFWPLFIVFAGLNLIFNGSNLFTIILTSLSVLIFLMIIIWSIAVSSVTILKDRFNITVPAWMLNINTKYSDLGAQKSSMLEVKSADYTNIEKRIYDINIKAGDLKLSNSLDDTHMKLDSQYFEKWGEPVLDVSRTMNQLDISLKTKSEGNVSFIDNTPKYSFDLGNSQIDSDINIEFGAGKGEIILSQFGLRNYSVKLGAGEMTTDFSNINGKGMNINIGAGKMTSSFSDVSLNSLKVDVGMGEYELNASRNFKVTSEMSISVGTGKAVINLPDNVGYRVKYDLGIGSMTLGTKTISGFGNSAKSYESPNYSTAESKIEIKANVGIGELVIK